MDKVEAARILLGKITVRQVIGSGEDVIAAVGLNTWCINEGLAAGDESADAGRLLSGLSDRLLAAERLAEAVEKFLTNIDRAAQVEGDWDRLTLPPVRAALTAWKEASK